jgi:peptidyl-prolyl cis-trans isomerase SurA
MFVKFSSFLMLFGFMAIGLIAQNQNEEILMTIDGQNVSLEEFNRIYQKNNHEGIAEKQTVEEYLEMFVNFKLKVIEAENRGMDTTSSFLKEFDGYRDQLAKPYLSDPEITEELSKEAYERMKKEIHASHIMIRLDPKASPDDTLYAYNKLLNIRKRILDGEDFEKVARATSDDPSAKQNGGDLGWFSVFRMVYPFEEVAYNTAEGEISLPFRTNFGYHIVKVYETRPARGSVQVAHIFLRTPESLPQAEAEKIKDEIYAIYDSLSNGADFSDIAMRRSDDKSTAEKGGLLPPFSSGQMIIEFENAAFSLKKPGDFTTPVKSFYGWHILKLVKRTPIASYEEEKAEIMSKVLSGGRAYLKDEAFVNKLKSENDYHFYPKTLEDFYTLVDTSVFNASWKANLAAGINEEILFQIGDLSINAGTFAEYIESNQKQTPKMDIRTYLNDLYQNFEKKEIVNFEKANLESKYPEYKNILQEYHDGILLFDLTDKEVWSKAVEDTAGLEAFYSSHKNDYMWTERAEAYTIRLNDESLLKDARTIIGKYGKKSKFNESFLKKKLCPGDSIPCFELEYGKYEKGVNEEIDKTNWTVGLGETYFADEKPEFIFVLSIQEPTVKKLDEARGLITADYQNFLEKKWIQELRDKYPVTINEELLRKIEN